MHVLVIAGVNATGVEGSLPPADENDTRDPRPELSPLASVRFDAVRVYRSSATVVG